MEVRENRFFPLTGMSLALLETKGATRALISLTHLENSVASAIVILISE